MKTVTRNLILLLLGACALLGGVMPPLRRAPGRRPR